LGLRKGGCPVQEVAGGKNLQNEMAESLGVGCSWVEDHHVGTGYWIQSHHEEAGRDKNWHKTVAVMATSAVFPEFSE
jgi:hypothetical protein